MLAAMFTILVHHHRINLGVIRWRIREPILSNMLINISIS